MAAYLDHAATTPVRTEVVDAMISVMTQGLGNPSGMHATGRSARQAIDEARDEVATALGCDPSEVVFTSGGTESDNLAILGGAGAEGVVLCSAVEHHAVLRAVESLGDRGRTIPVDAMGLVDLVAFEAMLDDNTAMVSVMMVNNEIGTIQPLHKIKRLMERKAPNALLHTDAVQAPAWVDIASFAGFADLVSISAHKFGGPQGVGALVVRKNAKLVATSHGGGQERERRSGTHNVAGIVGMAEALKLTVAEREREVIRVAALRDRLVDELLAAVPGSFETGDRATKTAGNAHLCFGDIESESLLVLLDQNDMYASAGASCSSGAMEPSHVLTAMGFSSEVAGSSLRMTLGRTTTEHEIDVALKAVPEAVLQLRGASR